MTTAAEQAGAVIDARGAMLETALVELGTRQFDAGFLEYRKTVGCVSTGSQANSRADDEFMIFR